MVFLLLHEILVRQRWRPIRAGALLGLVIGVQYLISAEIATSTMLMVVLACVVAAFTCRAHAPVHWSYLRPAAFSWFLVTCALVAYPVLFGFFGTAGISGVLKQPGGQGDLLGPFVPGPEQWLAPVNSVWTQFDQYFAAAPMYLGIPFVVAVVATAIWLVAPPDRAVLRCHDRLRLRALARQHTPGAWHRHGDPPPIRRDRPSTHRERVGGRPVLAVHCALRCGRARPRTRRGLPSRATAGGQAASGWRSAALVGMLGAAVVVVALPMVPSSTRPSSAAPVTPYFTSSAVRSLPNGSVALVYPYPGAVPKLIHGRPVTSYPFAEQVDDILLDQAVAGMRFRLIGGYGWMPPKRTDGVPDPTPLAPASVQALFDVSFYGSPTPAQQRLLATSSLTADLREFLLAHQVDEVIALPVGRHPERVVTAVTTAIGPPTRSGGATIWLHVPARLAALGAPG